MARNRRSARRGQPLVVARHEETRIREKVFRRFRHAGVTVLALRRVDRLRRARHHGVTARCRDVSPSSRVGCRVSIACGRLRRLGAARRARTHVARAESTFSRAHATSRAFTTCGALTCTYVRCTMPSGQRIMRFEPFAAPVFITERVSKHAGCAMCTTRPNNAPSRTPTCAHERTRANAHAQRRVGARARSQYRVQMRITRRASARRVTKNGRGCLTLRAK